MRAFLKSIYFTLTIFLLPSCQGLHPWQFSQNPPTVGTPAPSPSPSPSPPKQKLTLESMNSIEQVEFAHKELNMCDNTELMEYEFSPSKQEQFSFSDGSSVSEKVKQELIKLIETKYKQDHGEVENNEVPPPAKSEAGKYKEVYVQWQLFYAEGEAQYVEDDSSKTIKYKYFIGNKDPLISVRSLFCNSSGDAQNDICHSQVKTGDTLWELADKYYGDGTYYEVIYFGTLSTPEMDHEDKNTLGDNPDLIFPGQWIIIPPKDIATKMKLDLDLLGEEEGRIKAEKRLDEYIQLFVQKGQQRTPITNPEGNDIGMAPPDNLTKYPRCQK